MNATYTINMNYRERVCAYPDMTTYSLEDVIGEEYGVVVLDGPRGMTGTYGNIHHMEDAIRGLADNFYRGSSDGWWDRRNRAIHLYLNLSGFDSVIHTLQGHSQGEWCEIVLFRKRDVDWHISDYNIVDTIPYVNAWFAGDIYSLIHEKLETFANINDPDDTIERWSEIDAIHCQIILESKDFVEIAQMEFDITKEDYLVKIG
jgi:hypothetical protein